MAKKKKLIRYLKQIEKTINDHGGITTISTLLEYYDTNPDELLPFLNDLIKAGKLEMQRGRNKKIVFVSK